MTKAFEQFDIGDWVSIDQSYPSNPGLVGQVVSIEFNPPLLKVRPRGYWPLPLPEFDDESAKKHLTLLEAV